MLERHEALKALKVLRKAVSAVEELTEPDQIEPALDAVASLLAYLASRNLASRETAKAASRLLERSSIERYDGSIVEEEPDEVSKKDRDELFAGLESIYEELEAENEELEAENENDDEGA
jgi:hypothetical protein